MEIVNNLICTGLFGHVDKWIIEYRKLLRLPAVCFFVVLQFDCWYHPRFLLLIVLLLYFYVTVLFFQLVVKFCHISYSSMRSGGGRHFFLFFDFFCFFRFLPLARRMSCLSYPARWHGMHCVVHSAHFTHSGCVSLLLSFVTTNRACTSIGSARTLVVLDVDGWGIRFNMKNNTQQYRWLVHLAQDSREILPGIPEASGYMIDVSLVLIGCIQKESVPGVRRKPSNSRIHASRTEHETLKT